MDFEILKKSKKSKARIGIIKTKNGVIETPSLIPVATQGVLKTLESREAEETKSQGLICNTFHLHIKPGEKIISSAGGLHKFMNWSRPLMTDSGGFQVFSLGFGRDRKISKVLKKEFGQNFREFKKEEQPRFLKITKDGVYFNSPVDGEKLFLGPKESIKIQEKLGADIILAFDECPPPFSSKEYIKESLKRTHNWAYSSFESHKSDQALFGIIQGGRYKELRTESTEFIKKIPFDGFGIGGEFGQEKNDMRKMLNIVIRALPDKKPRHLLGIGHLSDIETIIKEGVDTFDCTVPTHYARRGIAFAKEGKLNLNQSKFLKDKKPISSKCSCSVCRGYKRNYISHLLRAKEITALRLISFHNLYFFNTFIEELREKIKKNRL